MALNNPKRRLALNNHNLMNPMNHYFMAFRMDLRYNFFADQG